MSAASDVSSMDGEEASLRVSWSGAPRSQHVLSRFITLRALGFIYSVAFSIALLQFEGLIGERGLLPATRYLERIAGHTTALEWPTLFWLGSSDGVLRSAAALGLALSLAVLAGVENGLVMAALWALYISFCHVGQIFWGYGWEILLLEAGFLSIFLCPVRTLRPLNAGSPPSLLVVWGFYWLCFRVMFGAGLIKLRGDDCWTELTCLATHYETQPVPNPVSPLLHAMPLWFHQLGVLYNHYVELLAPFMLLGPRRLRIVGALSIVVFQAILIVSGNLSFLNWLTIAVCLPCFDDRFWRRSLPRLPLVRGEPGEPSRAATVVTAVLALGIALLSIGPVVNMLSPRQAMNTSFDPYHLVNSYGAFGSVGEVRHEVIVQGSEAESPEEGDWREYAFHCKPGDVARRPCLISPYHYRIDWQMWFAALGRPEDQQWLIHMLYKLLRAEPAVLGLLAEDPFDGRRPTWVRAELYRYAFSDEHDVVWKRERVGGYLVAMRAGDRRLLDYLGQRGFLGSQ